MWKVFDDHHGRPRLLYHGLRGRRALPLDAWLAAEIKWVSEGSNPYYWSAFHCYLDIGAIGRWLRRCRKITNRVAVEVDVKGVTKKPTKGEAYLARSMRVGRRQWTQRIPLDNLCT